MNRKKVVVIGIDGMSPELFDVLVEKDIFRNLKELKETGTSSLLRSTLPPVTSPAWATFATGVNPGKHGIYDFALPRESLLRITTVSSREIAVKTLYELLEEQGLKSILINLPMSWPALTDNPTITSFLTKGEDLVFPRNLVERIPKLREYRLTPTTHPRRDYIFNDPDLINDIRDLEKTRFETALELLKLDWEFFFILFSGSDWLSHWTYEDLISGTAESEIWQLFEEIDQYIGEIYETVRYDANLFILSDHGFRVTDKYFNINHWLEQEGYLKRSRSKELKKESHAIIERHKARDSKRKIDLTPIYWIRDIPVISSFLRTAYHRARKYLPFSLSFREGIEPDRTIAFSTSRESWGIYINSKDRFSDGCVDGSLRHNLAKELKERLKELKLTRENQPVLREVLLREDIYSGRELQKAPDIVLIPNEGWAIRSFLARGKVFTYGKGSDHDLDGVFIAHGPDIANGKMLDGLSMQDVPVTLFHILDVPIFKYMDGKVIDELFDERSALKGKEVKYDAETERFLRQERSLAQDEEDSDIVKERLKGLGYM
jgi:predicted AlkP superfamily phosphohydrolase/phosphomutase